MTDIKGFESVSTLIPEIIPLVLFIKESRVPRFKVLLKLETLSVMEIELTRLSLPKTLRLAIVALLTVIDVILLLCNAVFISESLEFSVPSFTRNETELTYAFSTII